MFYWRSWFFNLNKYNRNLVNFQLFRELCANAWTIITKKSKYEKRTRKKLPFGRIPIFKLHGIENNMHNYLSRPQITNYPAGNFENSN